MISHHIRRYRRTCLNAYGNRRERSQNFDNNTAYPNFWATPLINGVPVILTEPWNYAAGDFQTVVPNTKWTSTEVGTHCQVFQNQVQVGFTSAQLTAIRVPVLNYNTSKQHGCTAPLQPEGGNISGNQIFQMQIDTDGINFSSNSNSVLLQLAYNSGSPGAYVLEYFSSTTGTETKSGSFNFTFGTNTLVQLDVGPWNGASRAIKFIQDGTTIDTLTDTGGPSPTQKIPKLFFQSQTTNPTAGFNVGVFKFYGRT